MRQVNRANERVDLGTRMLLEEFTRNHLQSRSIPDSVQVRRIVTCASCGWTVSEQDQPVVDRKIERGALGHSLLRLRCCHFAENCVGGAHG
jgi:hypothetical protein